MKLALALALLAGCSGFIDDKAASSTLKILRHTSTAAGRLGDVQLARDALPGGIIQLEAFALAYPGHRDFRVMHADSLCQYAIAFVFDDWEDATFTGRDADATRLADRLGPLLDSCVAAQRALLPANWTVETTTRAQVPHVLWLGMAGSVRIALSPLANLPKLPEVKATLTKSATLWPGYHDADAELMLGMLEAAQSAMFRGADGSAWFDKARKLSPPGNLNIDVLYARGVAVAHKDRELFTTTLERVISADMSQWPERRLANEMARMKARRYLAAVDKLIR